jgi:hypothetical protein
LVPSSERLTAIIYEYNSYFTVTSLSKDMGDIYRYRGLQYSGFQELEGRGIIDSKVIS